MKKTDRPYLSAYLDGECSWWRSLWIKHSLKNCQEERKALADLKTSNALAKQAALAQLELECSEINLSVGVLEKIQREERQRFLGRFAIEAKNEKISFATLCRRLISSDRFVWSSFGALAASLVLLVLLPALSFNPKLLSTPELESSNFSRDVLSLTKPDSRFNLTSFSAEADPNNWNLPRKQLAPKVVEVDWLRSTGRVKVLKDPKGRGSIFWIDRKMPFSNQAKNLATVNTPQIKFVANK